MAFSLNRVLLVGNLTRDPQLSYLPSNTAVCEFTLAINRRWKDQQGNQKEDVCFIDCSSFGKQGEVISKYVKKGEPLFVEGHLKQDNWTAQDGSKRSKLRVTVERFEFVASRRENGGGPGGGGPGAGGGAPQGQGAYRRGPQQAAPPVDAADPLDDRPPAADDPPGLPDHDNVPF